MVSLRDHHTLCIGLFVLLYSKYSSADTAIYDCAFIVRHVLPRYIPGMMFPPLRHFGPDDEIVPQKMVIDHLHERSEERRVDGR